MQELPSTPDMPEPYDAPEPQEAPEAHFSSRPEAGLAETGVDLPEPESSLPEPEANLPEPGATPDFLTPSSGSQLPNRARTGAAAGAKPKTGKRRRRAKGQRTRSQRPRSRRFHFLRDIINILHRLRRELGHPGPALRFWSPRQRLPAQHARIGLLGRPVPHSHDRVDAGHRPRGGW